MSEQERKTKEYYCPKCLDSTTLPNYVPDDEWLRELKPGECMDCFINVGLHVRYEQIGEDEITDRERRAFLEDPARKSDPRFDPEAYSKRVNYKPFNYDDLGNSGVQCPYCHSNKTRKISDFSKAVNTAVFGIFGNKRRYQWHCNSCGSDF